MNLKAYAYRGLALVALLSLPVGSATGCSSTEVTREAIPHETKTESDDSAWVGQTTVSVAGVDGEREVKWRVRGGDPAKRERVSDKVIKEPVDQIELVGTKDKATGRTIEMTRDNGARFRLSIQDVQRNSAMGGDTLVINAHLVNLNDDDFLRLTGLIRLAFLDQDLIGYEHLPGNRGITNDVTLSGGEEADCVFEYRLRTGSVKRAQVESVDDFVLNLGGRGPLKEPPLPVPLSAFWIGPIDGDDGASNVLSPTEADGKTVLPDGVGPVAAIARHYDALMAKSYDDAYAYLPVSAKSVLPLADFEKLADSSQVSAWWVLDREISDSEASVRVCEVQDNYAGGAGEYTWRFAKNGPAWRVVDVKWEKPE